MNLDSKGEAFLKAREGLRLEAYLDTKSIPTIGWGTTVYPNGKKVKIGDHCTVEQAQSYFDFKVKEFEDTVNRYTNLDPIRNDDHDIITAAITQNMYNALVALCYNIGSTGYKGSTVARYASSKLRVDHKAMSSAFLMWNKESKIINGIKVYEVNPGLVNRRKKEIELYFS